MHYPTHAKEGAMDQRDVLHLDDFSDAPAGRAEERAAERRGSPRRSTTTVALHFDEDEVEPSQIERETFQQLLRVVPEFRRELERSGGQSCSPCPRR